MNQLKISAKELSEDIKSGMTKLMLIEKYNIPGEEKLIALIKKLIEKGFLSNEESKSYLKNYNCPSCGAEIDPNVIECPMCGIVFSKLKRK